MEKQATADFSSPQPSDDSIFCFDDMERTNVRHEIRVPCRRRSEVLICNFRLMQFSRHLAFKPAPQLPSGSMEPAFQRGDILFLNNQDSPIRVGEIVVFKIKDRDIPIVHRVMKVHEKEDGKVHSASLWII